MYTQYVRQIQSSEVSVNKIKRNENCLRSKPLFFGFASHVTTNRNPSRRRHPHAQRHTHTQAHRVGARNPHIIGAMLDRFYFSSRAVACFRLALAAVVIADLCGYYAVVDDFLSDDGLLPRAVLVEEILHPAHISLCLASGKSQIQVAFIFTGVVSAVFVALGFYTRTSAAVTWFMLASIQLQI